MNVLGEFTKKYKKWGRDVVITKRQQFIAVTVVLVFGLIVTQLASPDWRYPLVSGLAVAAYGLSLFALREDLSGIEHFTLLALPTLFTAAVAFSYFLLPVRWITRLPVAVLFGVGFYALLLTENIYNVASERSIALLRAAHSVGFLLTLVTYFLLLLTILAFRFAPFINSLAIGATGFLLVVQSLWALQLEEAISARIWRISIVLSILFMELSWTFGFWPVKLVLVALFLTTLFYSTVGIAQQYLLERLYKKTVIEFFSVLVIVLGIVIFATHWRGQM
jgi:hypothetical protein